MTQSKSPCDNRIAAGNFGQKDILMLKTELKDLKESNEFLNLLLDNINSAILIADENLQIHHFNNSFLNLFDQLIKIFDAR